MQSSSSPGACVACLLEEGQNEEGQKEEGQKKATGPARDGLRVLRHTKGSEKLRKACPPNDYHRCTDCSSTSRPVLGMRVFALLCAGRTAVAGAGADNAASRPSTKRSQSRKVRVSLRKGMLTCVANEADGTDRAHDSA